MCLPVIAPLLGGIVSGVGAAMGNKANAASLDAQAAFKKRQAVIENETAGYKSARVQDDIDRTLGAQRAGFAANGLALTGSAGDVVAETAEEGALDKAAILWNSKLEQDNLKYQAKVDKMNAKTERSAAIISFLSPVISGGAEAFASYKSSFA